jgi:hypothetical protein
MLIFKYCAWKIIWLFSMKDLVKGAPSLEKQDRQECATRRKLLTGESPEGKPKPKGSHIKP